MTPERLAALEAEAAERENGTLPDTAAVADKGPEPDHGADPESPVKLDESLSPVAGRRFTRA